MSERIRIGTGLGLAISKRIIEIRSMSAKCHKRTSPFKRVRTNSPCRVDVVSR
jgi:hypothetical protein